MEIKNIGQLISHLATKSGIDKNDQHLINILSNAELTKVTVHSDLVKALDENLLSVESATDNHPVIGSRYKAEALNPIDKKIHAMIDEFDLDEDAKNEIKSIKSTYKRFETLAAKIKDLKTEKAASGESGKDALQKQIDDLLQKMQTEKAAYEQKLQNLEALRTADRVEFEKRGLYNSYKTIYDSLDGTIKKASLDAIINKELQDREAEFGYDEKGSFIIRKKDGSNLVGANHTKYNPQTFIDEILAQNKILVVAESAASTQQTTTPTTVGAGDGHDINGTNQTVANYNLEALKALQ